MALHVGQVNAQVDVAASGTPDGRAAGKTGAAAGTPLGGMHSDSDLRERLRPIVLEIIDGELERIRMQFGYD